MKNIDTLDESNELVPLIGKTGKMIMLYMTHKFEINNYDLTPKQWIVLRYLLENEGKPQKDLALLTNRDKTSFTRLINSMERKGLVERIVSEKDKRVNELYITEKGTKVFEELRPIMLETLREMQVGIGGRELEIAVKVVKQLQNNIKELTS